MIDFFDFYMWMVFGLVILAFIGFILSIKKESEIKKQGTQRTGKAKKA